MSDSYFFVRRILLSFFCIAGGYLLGYGQPTVATDLPQERVALVCPDLQITAVSWLDESVCEALDGQLFFRVLDPFC
jgi:hypothetical protein